MDNKLAEILGNSTSGSSELLLSLNDYLLANIKDLEELNILLPLIRGKLKHFAAVDNYLDKIHTLVESRDYRGFVDFAKQTISEAKHKYIDLYQKAKPFLKSLSTIITISNSNTLFEILRLWKSEKNNIKIIVSESRPKEEGKIFAQNLLECGINVLLITDAMVGMYMQRCDAAVIGADQVLKNGDVINKTGSSMFAILAKYYGKPFYVIASKNKQVESNEYKPEEYPAAELWDMKHKNLEIKNYYFETVDRQLISQMITD